MSTRKLCRGRRYFCVALLIGISSIACKQSADSNVKSAPSAKVADTGKPNAKAPEARPPEAKPPEAKRPESPAPGLEKTYRVLDTNGSLHAIPDNDGRSTVIVFVSPECPISRTYTAELNTLARSLDKASIGFFGVISDRTVTRAAALAFAKQFGFAFPLVLDPSGTLLERLRPTVTPEAFVLEPAGNIAYHGRIDDLYQAVDKPRDAATTHDLKDAIARLKPGVRTATPVTTTAVGCVIESNNYALPADLNYAKDVAPILNGYCADCHHTKGPGPFPLQAFEDVKKRARMLVSVTHSRYMPPYHSVPGAFPMKDQLWLSERELGILERWYGRGAPMGDAAETPPARTFPRATFWSAGKPDLVFSMPKPFRVPADGPEIYRSFVIGKLPYDAAIIAFDTEPGVPSIVHHANLYQDATGKARQMEKDEGGYGFKGNGRAAFGAQSFVRTWGPGVRPTFLPAGMAQVIKKGTDLVLEIHYKPSGKVEQDVTKVGLYLSKVPVEKPVSAMLMRTTTFHIAPGAADYVVSHEITLPVPATLTSFRPHMHKLGKSTDVTAKLPSGEILPLLKLANWDNSWQQFYTFTQPIRLPAGTTFHYDCIFDNSENNPLNPSSPPETVGWGWGTKEEMCVTHTVLAFDSAADLGAFYDAVRAKDQKENHKLESPE